jgi:2-C-methyl-D-erythritol 2,4-cyclodiphosphate synthase
LFKAIPGQSAFSFQIVSMSFRIGFGVDFHRLAEGRKLILGGVHIPFEKGALGHSDADVLLHAICDAMLGALNLGDIGVHFPDTDPAFENIDSKVLLQRVFELIKKNNYRVVNIDSSICLEEPKIRRFTDDMRVVIASLLNMQQSDISIKATTTEGMGFVGRGEGLIAYATLLLEKGN